MPEADGPHVRLGVLWALVTFVVVLAHPVAAGAWMSLHAALAMVQVERSHGGGGRAAVVSAVGAGLFAFACAFGLIGAAVGLALAASAAAASTAQGSGHLRPRTVAAAVWLGAAAGSIVLARTIAPVPGLYLLGLLCAFDTGNYLVGTGAKNAWEGPAAGIAAMLPVILLGATLAVPPLTETGPWVLGALAVPLAPLGSYAGSALLGREGGRVPALRRIDTLLLLGSAWVAGAHVLRADVG